jgi:hypothetical protein
VVAIVVRVKDKNMLEQIQQIVYNTCKLSHESNTLVDNRLPLAINHLKFGRTMYQLVKGVKYSYVVDIK